MEAVVTTTAPAAMSTPNRQETAGRSTRSRNVSPSSRSSDEKFTSKVCDIYAVIKKREGWVTHKAGPENWCFITPLIAKLIQDKTITFSELWKHGIDGIHFAHGWIKLGELLLKYGVKHAPKDLNDKPPPDPLLQGYTIERLYDELIVETLKTVGASAKKLSQASTTTAESASGDAVHDAVVDTGANNNTTKRKHFPSLLSSEVEGKKRMKSSAEGSTNRVASTSLEVEGHTSVSPKSAKKASNTSVSPKSSIRTSARSTIEESVCYGDSRLVVDMKGKNKTNRKQVDYSSISEAGNSKRKKTSTKGAAGREGNLAILNPTAPDLKEMQKRYFAYDELKEEVHQLQTQAKKQEEESKAKMDQSEATKEQLENTILEKEGSIKQLVSEKEQLHFDMNQMRAQLEGTVHNLQAEAVERRLELASKKDTIVQLEGEVQRLKDENDNLRYRKRKGRSHQQKSCLELDEEDEETEDEAKRKRRRKESRNDEELRGLDKELVQRIKNQIVDSGEKVTFDDIAGLEHAKDYVNELVTFPMQRPDLFTGLRSCPKGLLLFGPPGTGKTMVAKAIAYESRTTFFSISSSALTSKWLGEGEKMVKTLFLVAYSRAPSIVFIDEVDSMLTQRDADEGDAMRRIKTEFLVQFDGLSNERKGHVLVIGATNLPQELDNGARRRFPIRLYVPLPNQPARETLLRTLLAKNSHSLTNSDIENLSRDTDGYSGADLKNLCTDASMGPMRDLGTEAMMSISPDNVPPISYDHFRRSLHSTSPSVGQEDLQVYVDWNKNYGTKPGFLV